MSTRETGTKHENTAADYLKKHGLTLVARNYRVRDGEIDLIMRDKHVLVFIEVKFRSNCQFAAILEQINQQQLKRIRRSAQLFMLHHGIVEHLTACRFDVVAIIGEPFQIEWLKDAF